MFGIVVEQAQPHGKMGTSSTNLTVVASSTSDGNNKRKMASRSKVWNDFYELTHVIDDKIVRYSVLCKYCKHISSARSSCGTSHLLRYNCLVNKEQECDDIAQSVLKCYPNRYLVRWECFSAVARNESCRLIAREHLSLWIGHSEAFVKCSR